jgi:diguanylate cyclase (GGDEF)-like protein/PAS domain S-box-containing protein
MRLLITKPRLIAAGALICGLASLSMLVYLAGGNIFISGSALIIAGLVSAGIYVNQYKSSIQADAVRLANSLEGIAGPAARHEPLQTINPLFEPISEALAQLMIRTEQETSQSKKHQEKTQSFFDSMADGLITVTEKGVIETVNTAGLNLLGQDAALLPGAHLSSFVVDSACISARCFLESFIKNSSIPPDNYSTDIKKADGSIFPARFSVSKLKHPDGNLFIIVFSDISDIRSMEKQLRSVNLELSKTNERLEKTSITDALTQLFNRRHFDSMFHKELQRATRARTSLSLIIIDIDFFKQYNDIYGHTAGDDCIKKVAGTIKQVFKRSGDLPSRYGGEEFAIILPGCDGLELQERAETMRHAVCDLAIPHSGSKAHENLSISIGAVTYKPAAQELIAPKPKDLFSEADKALYRAKARGRNQVVFAGQYQPMQMPSGLGGIYGQLISR